jgi:hypothetical protein
MIGPILGSGVVLLPPIQQNISLVATFKCKLKEGDIPGCGDISFF